MGLGRRDEVWEFVGGVGVGSEEGGGVGGVNVIGMKSWKILAVGF